MAGSGAGCYERDATKHPSSLLLISKWSDVEQKNTVPERTYLSVAKGILRSMLGRSIATVDQMAKVICWLS